jgi:hypothetical protein
MAGPFYFAWTGPNETTFDSSHIREDELIFSVVIDHAEGEFPSLTIEVLNTGTIGLLAAGRNQWCWLSWDGGSGAQPLFRGRLIGIPQNLHLEVIQLSFTARALDYTQQQINLAQSLAVQPFYDPIWIAETAALVDVILEARSQHWHIDRLSLAVTVSDIIAGEDGTLDVTADQHFYEDMSVSYGSTPLTAVNVTGTVSWEQVASGDVDLTRKLWLAFSQAGQPSTPYPVVSSLTSDGLISDWPAPNAGMGGGWSIGDGTAATAVYTISPKSLSRRFSAVTADATATVTQPPIAASSTAPVNPFDNKSIDLPPPTNPTSPDDITTPAGSAAPTTDQPKSDFTIVVPLGYVSVALKVHYDAKKSRSETVQFSLLADTQPLLTDPGADELDTVNVTSSVVDKPVDPGGVLPIGDPARASYFQTDRGQQSFEYLLALARAKLLARARAVNITFSCPWALALPLSCRWNVKLYDNRLPGGGAIGKVTAYKLSFDGTSMIASVTIGCTVGMGNDNPDPNEGEPVYVDDGYVDPGYQQFIDGQISLLGGTILYESLDDFTISGELPDLQNMNPDSILDGPIVIAGSPNAQAGAIDAALAAAGDSPDPAGALKNTPTTVTVNLLPVSGGSFLTTFSPLVSALMVPKTIDLEADG